MLNKFRNLWCPSCFPWGKGELCEECSLAPVERWAMKNSKITTPEQIIVAAIIESIVKNFDDWSGGTFPTEPKRSASRYDSIPPVVKLINEKKNVTVTFGTTAWDKREVQDGFSMIKCRYYYGDWAFEGTKVGDVDIGASGARAIFQAWTKISEKVSAVQRAAALAEDRMKRNEKAWNLAEDLLGMKRNEFGALVPKVSVEDENSDSDSKTEAQKEEA